MVVAGNNKPEAAPRPDKVRRVGTTTAKCKLPPHTFASVAARDKLCPSTPVPSSNTSNGRSLRIGARAGLARANQ